MGEPKPDEKDIFNTARRIESPEARQLYLAQACGEDRDLCARVEALLRVHAQDATFLESPAVVPPDALAAESPGTVIGSYTLVRQLGQGGMGVVFLAEQARPVQRQVALKIVRPGMDGPQVIARFEAERQALALMDHPSIARVLDAGTTPAGRSYFVMELVQGVPITRYCDDNHLTPRQRLELFVSVCQGVQHAHQKGIIHRDIKPSNVLVALYDERPAPRIIDFGLAKATGRKLTEDTFVTAFGLVVGTLEYMSPEQAGPTQFDIDTRSDVYSLGVLLYELLTGTTPLHPEGMSQANLLDLLRMVREVEPPRPSLRLAGSAELSSIAANRGLEPKKLLGLVRGELDWIVMKCLDKDRDRRYESASALAHDVERYLRDEPVEASPPGAGYRLRKFARRHRTALATAAAFVLLLLVGVAVSTWQAVRARAASEQAVVERDDKEKARQHARRALNKLTDEAVERLLARQAEVTEEDREFLRHVLVLHEEFAGAQGDSPESRAGVADARFRVGVIRHRLGEFKEAEKAYRAAVELQQQLADDDPDQAEYRHDLARSQIGLSSLLRETGRPSQSEGACNRAVDLLTKLADDDPGQPDYRRDLAAAHINLGTVLLFTNRPQPAEKAWRTAIDILKKLVAEPHTRPDDRRLLAGGYQNLGNLLLSTGSLKEAEDSFIAGRDHFQKLADDFPRQPDHRRELARLHGNLGVLYAQTRGPRAAEKAFRSAIAIQRKLADEFPARPEYRALLASSHFNLGNLLTRTKQRRKAVEAFLAARDLLGRLATDHPKVTEYQSDLARTLVGLALLKALEEDYTTARQLLEQAVPHYQSAIRAEPNNPSHQEGYRHLHAILAGVFLTFGNYKKAAAAADELARFAHDQAEDACAAASIVAQCATLAAADGRLTEAKRKETAQAHADRAMVLLRQAVKHGFKNSALLQGPAFASLHARADFARLLRDLRATRGRP